MSQHTLIIDGMALLFRHFYATSFRNQFMYNKKDLPTNGVQGMLRHTFKLLELTQPDHVIVAWDMGSKSVRNEWFEGYKANRVAPPEEMVPQFDMIKDVIHDIGFYQDGVRGYEADDVIGTVAQHIDDLTIVSGDRDLLQLINRTNRIWLTKKGYTEYHHYNYDAFLDQYGITPEQFIDVKALMGDASDGYSGVQGIGEKTALKLIQTHGSVEALLNNLDTLTPKMQEKINNDMESLQMSQRLARIITDVPLKIDTMMDNSRLNLDTVHINNVLADHDLSVAQKYLSTLNFR
ncbi:5'-3' exonuclease [Jeotgalicoccus aerolatus]|uniref:5'-3' exonuclease n=1 Tax=Jeotgalicoccus aerolatus TaxID=709510 RepID=A0ABS4HLN7_9STAP|nr:5'-3' exonuclease [Jeotgalicoccus aerolatus]MBP1951817.1 5'-3' exonuclease [Jeotgalicoccus aerolatus]GGD94554.1 5'-3' exonuclease [Jeotgalicoccus aerolatus]CAD2075076.1 5'-3' exonuclease [Jeotgalicoccus aerolatus]HJG32178.1 5'-3' exonuclease [Jeotgalicoccus aerolatus]